MIVKETQGRAKIDNVGIEWTGRSGVVTHVTWASASKHQVSPEGHTKAMLEIDRASESEPPLALEVVAGELTGDDPRATLEVADERIAQLLEVGLWVGVTTACHGQPVRGLVAQIHLPLKFLRGAQRYLLHVLLLTCWKILTIRTTFTQANCPRRSATSRT